MPKYRVIVEARLDIEAEDEDAAKLAAVKRVDVDHCIAWEFEDEAGKRGGEGQNDWGFSVGDRVLHKEIRSSKKCGSGFGTVISADAEAIRVKWDDSANGTPWFGTYDKDWFRIHPGVMIVMTTGDPPSGKDA